ncbi:unnamed protein product, partial [Discosporangium mesarthrocarpum]
MLQAYCLAAALHTFPSQGHFPLSNPGNVERDTAVQGTAPGTSGQGGGDPMGAGVSSSLTEGRVKEEIQVVSRGWTKGTATARCPTGDDKEEIDSNMEGMQQAERVEGGGEGSWVGALGLVEEEPRAAAWGRGRGKKDSTHGWGWGHNNHGGGEGQSHTGLNLAGLLIAQRVQTRLLGVRSGQEKAEIRAELVSALGALCSDPPSLPHWPLSTPQGLECRSESRELMETGAGAGDGEGGGTREGEGEEEGTTEGKATHQE